MTIARLRTYIRQFGLVSGARLMLADAVRHVLDRGSRVTYAQTGEDQAVRWFLGAEPGFYVDVGCNHPINYSNTFALYRRGWVGICIDANERLIRDFSRVRPRDLAVCAAISNREEEMLFTEFDDSLVSSLDRAHVDRYKESRRISAERRVQCRTLNAILREHRAPKEFDLLSIDVEGHDAAVLKSIDLEVYRPRMIVIEMHDFDIQDPDASDIYTHLISCGYRMAGYLIMNGYFVRNTQAKGPLQ